MLILQILLTIILLGILTFLLFQILTLPFYIFAMMKGAFYAPTSRHKVASMLKLVEDRQMKKMVDIGSGDGRIVIAFAKKGILADGFEINPILVLSSRLTILRSRLQHMAHIYLQDFWQADFSQYDVVTVYGITHIMPRLQQKLEKELKPGAVVISNHFQLPHWKIQKQIDDIILYEKVPVIEVTKRIG